MEKCVGERGQEGVSWLDDSHTPMEVDMVMSNCQPHFYMLLLLTSDY